MKIKQEYDVVVIGAGPAGSIAARTAAQGGLSTLLLEKRQEIGAPVRCGEAVGRGTVAKFIALDPRWIAAEISTFSVTSADGACVVLPPLEETLVLERKLFDLDLAHAAGKAGADVIVKARATGFSREEDGHLAVSISWQGEPVCVRSRIVIGADGTEAQSARWAGLDTNPPLRDYYVAAQYLVSGTDIDPHICRYYLGWGIAPSGYAWAFPKGDGKANVGLVMIPSPREHKTALDYLNAFVYDQFPRCSILAQVVGGIPITNVLPRMVTDGYLAVGDAAHQSDPLTAGGITNGMYGGLFAAQVAVDAVRTGDVSAKFLSRYESRWDAEFGKLYRRLYRIRHALYRVPDAKLCQMIARASKLDMHRMTLKDIVALVIAVDPHLLMDVMPYFLGQ
jgi:digeranylgeranylglycerophospholipid reductase